MRTGGQRWGCTGRAGGSRALPWEPGNTWGSLGLGGRHSTQSSLRVAPWEVRLQAF